MTLIDETLILPLNPTSNVARFSGVAIEEPLAGDHLPAPSEPDPQDQPIGWTAWSG